VSVGAWRDASRTSLVRGGLLWPVDQGGHWQLGLERRLAHEAAKIALLSGLEDSGVLGAQWGCATLVGRCPSSRSSCAGAGGLPVNESAAIQP
jgi:hypothetical protein